MPDIPEPPDEITGQESGPGRAVLRWWRRLGVLAVLISIVLAVGALLLVLDWRNDPTTWICNRLTFGSAEADRANALMRWGIGSVAYLGVGLTIQMVPRARM